MFQSQFKRVARFFTGDEIKGYRPPKPSKLTVEKFKELRQGADSLIRSTMKRLDDSQAPLALVSSLVHATCEAITNLIDSCIHNEHRLMSLEDETWYFTRMKLLRERLRARGMMQQK